MQKYGIVNTDKLNMRDSGSTAGKILTVLARGTVLDILGDPGFDWLQVRVDGTTTQGYVSKVYLTLTDVKPGPTPIPAPTPPPVSAPTPPTPTPTSPAPVPVVPTPAPTPVETGRAEVT